jgi:hypothetical protein
MGANWRRGTLRIWIMASVLWCAVIAVISVKDSIVHVKISNTETWDYPSEMGVDAIRDDLRQRLKALDVEDRAWAANLSESRRAECHAIASSTPFTDQPSDCVKLFFSKDDRAVPTGWEDQIVPANSSLGQVIVRTATLAIGPPLLVLTLGLALIWVVAGFRPDKT